MEKEKTTDWHRMTGELDFNMTNDFLFRALMQEKIACWRHWPHL